MNKLFLLLIFSSALISNENWDKLLHYNYDTNSVKSRYFFLSGYQNPTPKQELEAILNELNNDLGNVVACNFPARYSYLKSHDYDIPNFNLKECKELNSFMNSFANDKLHLVFTSEYVNSPASAFGHTMILFSNNDESLEIGDAIHYAAKTPKDGFFKYAYRGSTGKYTGYFIREPFHKKIYDYNTLEQRYMYIYTLDFSKEQIRQLQYHLFELRKASFKYYFMDENCASQTTDLLNVVSDYSRDGRSNYYLPIDTIRTYEKNIIDKKRFIPLVNKLDILLKRMTKKEKRLFKMTISSNLQVDENYPAIVKEAMVYYSTFYFRRFHRVFKNYDSVMNQSYQKQNIVDNSLNPLEKAKPSNIGLGLYSKNNINYFNLQYRPLFVDMYDIQFGNMQQSAVDTFTWDLLVGKDSVKLNKFNLLNIKSFTEQSIYYKPASWALYSGVSRDNTFDKLMFNTELGVGRTMSMQDNLSANLLLFVGFDNSNLYMKPYINFNLYLSKNMKIVNETSFKQYNGDNYLENKSFISYKKNNYQYVLENISTNIKEKDTLRLSIKYNF